MKTFREFWPYYLREHQNKRCRQLHYVGTLLSLLTIFTGLVAGQMQLVPLALILGYGPAWIGHFFYEGNRPASFRHPLWSLAADFKMFYLAVLALRNRISQKLNLKKSQGV